jgi:hypothetical protein
MPRAYNRASWPFRSIYIMEMTRRSRILAASRLQRADRLPFFHYWRHSQVGYAEREARNRGMGMCWVRPSYVEVLHGVQVADIFTTLDGRPVVRRTFTTPIGSVSYAEFREPGTGQWHANRSWKDSVPWVVERLIKTPADYPVVKYIVDHTEYTTDYFPVEQAMDWLGDEGIVLDSLPHSPMQTLMIDWIGSEEGRFYYHHEDYPDLVEELYHAICKSRLPMYDIVAGSPAPAAMHGDNVDGWLVSPALFERYLMPVYEVEAASLHAHGKLLAVHMDGRLDQLKHLIARTPIDILDGLHPIPMGDLRICEALDLWPEKCLWLGFPGAIYELGTRETQAFMLDLLREVLPGERIAVIMSTENLVSNENLLALTAVLEHADLPLTNRNISQIASKLNVPEGATHG